MEILERLKHYKTHCPTVASHQGADPTDASHVEPANLALAKIIEDAIQLILSILDTLG